jgi:hypothetical protein
MTRILISDLQSESTQYLNFPFKTGNELNDSSVFHALDACKVVGGVQAGPNGEGCTGPFIIMPK